LLLWAALTVKITTVLPEGDQKAFGVRVFAKHRRNWTMPPKARNQQVYEELAGWYEHQGRGKLRDWFLVLAADAALSDGRADQAERVRQRLLHVKTHHLLRPCGSCAGALRSPNAQG
jgi:hypothetical protein